MHNWYKNFIGSIPDCYSKLGLRDVEGALILLWMNRVNILLKSLLQKAINQKNKIIHDIKYNLVSLLVLRRDTEGIISPVKI